MEIGAMHAILVAENPDYPGNSASRYARRHV
jgi:hypothetical protein